MHRLFITALLASVAVAPAYAGKKDKGDNILEQIQDRLEDKAFDRYEDKIERLEGRLEGAGDEERQRIENIIDSVTDKYEAKWGELPEEPPPDNPPPEEPVTEQLFKDDFNREDGSGLGNGWQESVTPPEADNAIRIQGNAAVLETDVKTSTGGETSSLYAQSPTFHADYQIASISYSVTGLAGAGTFLSEWTVNGNKWITIESRAVSEGESFNYEGKLIDTLTMEKPEEYLGSVEDGNYAVRFSFSSVNGSFDNAVAVDDFSLTQPAQTSEPFVGF
jgi:hypothetical protein